MPEILILDLRLPDIDGLGVLNAVRSGRLVPRVLFLTCRDDDVALHHTSAKNVFGMILKSKGFDTDLRAALKSISVGRCYFSATIQSKIRQFRTSPNAFFKLLSKREVEVLQLISEGQTDSEVAAIIGITEATAHSHRQNLMRKLDVHNSAGLQYWARERGFSWPRRLRGAD